MSERGGGSILNITAISAIQPIAGFALSVATWGGVIGFAKTLSLEVAQLTASTSTRSAPATSRPRGCEKVFAAGGEDPGSCATSCAPKCRWAASARVDGHRQHRRVAGVAARPLHHRHRHPGRRRPAASRALRGGVHELHDRHQARARATATRARAVDQRDVLRDPRARVPEQHPDREVFVGCQGAHHLWRAEGPGSSDAPTFLRRIGIERGDVVTIQLPNRIEFPVVFFALELIGAIANKVNPDFRVRELDYILRFSGSRALRLPRASSRASTTWRMAQVSCSQPFRSSTHVIVAGGSADGRLEPRAGHRASAPMRGERPRRAWTPTRSSAWPSPRAPPAIPNACCTRSTPRSAPCA